MSKKSVRRPLPRLPSHADFLQRLGKAIAVASLLIIASQLLGMAGYSYFEGMSAIDAYANAAMILSGMGPLASPQTTGGKIFAGTYALYSGLILILASGLVLSPVFHRVLHRFHLEREDDEKDH
jgi:hypothetical protein